MGRGQMKIKIAIVGVLVLSLVLFFAHALQAAEKSPQKPIVQILKVTKPVTIDGKLDEYSKPLIMMDSESFEKLLYNPWVGKNDLSADIYLLWDDQNLYLAAKVTDDAPFMNSKDGPDIWDGDCLETVFGMDEKADPQRLYFGKQDYQLGLSPGNNKDIKPGEWFWRRDDYREGIEVAAKPWDKGYILEAKIPFSVLGGFKPEVGRKFGFDVAVDDGDKNKREIQFVWAGTKDFYADPSQWGAAVLAAPQAALALSFSSLIAVVIGIVVIIVFISFVTHRPK